MVQAGATVRLTIPDLDVDYVNAQHQYFSVSNDRRILSASTVFKTDIPNLKSIKSAAITNATIDGLKTITFTVPADTPAGMWMSDTE